MPPFFIYPVLFLLEIVKMTDMIKVSYKSNQIYNKHWYRNACFIKTLLVLGLKILTH